MTAEQYLKSKGLNDCFVFSKHHIIECMNGFLELSNKNKVDKQSGNFKRLSALYKYVVGQLYSANEVIQILENKNYALETELKKPKNEYK